jgi:hypothetical protein
VMRDLVEIAAVRDAVPSVYGYFSDLITENQQPTSPLLICSTSRSAVLIVVCGVLDVLGGVWLPARTSADDEVSCATAGKAKNINDNAPSATITRSGIIISPA